MSERVVHHFEAVEIEEHHTDQPRVPASSGERGGQGIDEGHPVGRLGQVVAEGDLAQLGVQGSELLVGLEVALAEIELTQDQGVHLLMHDDHHHQKHRRHHAQQLGGTIVGHQAHHDDGHQQGQLEREEVGPARRGSDRIDRGDGTEHDQVDGPEVVVVGRREHEQWQ